ncbi:hypothetical protein JL721_10130 [Aureococcus anophagefferens]|nr:hypothetical protein JL721_10130 [Aureococcus anophagefferens]
MTIEPGASAYFKLSGFSNATASGALPTFFLEWDMSNNEQSLPMFFSRRAASRGGDDSGEMLTRRRFRDIPRYYEGAMSLFFDWYNWPAVTADAYNYAESDEGFDLYHCHSCGYLVSSCAYCWDEDLRSDGCAHTRPAARPPATTSI